MPEHPPRRAAGTPRGLTRREFGLATLAVAVAGCGPKVPPAPIDLAVYGDCRQFRKIHTRIANSIALRNPKAVVVAGDLVNHPELQKQWDDFREITKVYRDKFPFLPVIGNHDVHPSQAFTKQMNLTRNWYDKVIGDFHLIVMDSIDVFRDKEQLDWFQKTAETSKSKHKFVIFHHPPFLLDHKRMSEAPEVKANLHPLLVKHKVCAVFNGHQHAFYYTRRDGVPYVVTGGGGSSLGDLDTSLQIPGDLSRSIYHFVGLTVAGPKIEGHVFDPDGAEVKDLAFPVCEHA